MATVVENNNRLLIGFTLKRDEYGEKFFNAIQAAYKAEPNNPFVVKMAAHLYMNGKLSDKMVNRLYAIADRNK